MGIRARATYPLNRDRVRQRPTAAFQPEVVEGPQNGVAVSDGRRPVAVAQVAFPGHRVDLSRSPARCGPSCRYRFDRSTEPHDEVPDLGRGGPVPGHADRNEEAPPPQQSQRIASNRGGRATAGGEITQKDRHRLHRAADDIHHQPRRRGIGCDDATPQRQPDRLNRSLRFLVERHGRMSSRPRTGDCNDAPTSPGKVRSTSRPNRRTPLGAALRAAVGACLLEGARRGRVGERVHREASSSCMTGPSRTT
jgi:hypothetical protein